MLEMISCDKHKQTRKEGFSSLVVLNQKNLVFIVRQRKPFSTTNFLLPT